MPDTLTELHRRIGAVERQVGSLRRKGKAHGWQLNNCFDMHRFGGGKLLWAFDGHSRIQYGEVDNWNEHGGLTMGNYRAATHGGPNVTFDGVGEYLDNGDGPWQESLAEEFLVWSWCYPTSLAADRYIAAKWTTLNDNRSWRLFYNNGAGFFACTVSGLGTVASNVGVVSTRAVVVAHWYFVVMYFAPSTLLRIYVGREDDTALTADSNVAAPAQIFDGNRNLTIGAHDDPGGYMLGNIGKVLGRANVPSTDIDDHVNMLFQSTRDFYQE